MGGLLDSSLGGLVACLVASRVGGWVADWEAGWLARRPVGSLGVWFSGWLFGCLESAGWLGNWEAPRADGWRAG